MKRLCILLSIITIVFVNLACEDDFSPNAEWSESMVVYALLDQDEDTTWIRVQKCYLSNEDMTSMQLVQDSSNYAENDLSVQIVEWNATIDDDTEELTKTTPTGNVFDFSYKLLSNKQEGDFYAPNQPIYYCRTKGQLSTSKVYELRITNQKTGTIVTSETSLVGDIGSSANNININGNRGEFNFISKKVTCSWESAPRGKVYQMKIRFYYRMRGIDSLYYVDVKTGNIENTDGKLSVSTSMTQVTYCTELFNLIKDHETTKYIGDSVSLFLAIGNEALLSYINASQQPTTLVQERPRYSNINGGLGVFAARRQKIQQDMPVPKYADSPYRKGIKNLNIGF